MGRTEIRGIGDEVIVAIFDENTHLNPQLAVDQQAVREAANIIIGEETDAHNSTASGVRQWTAPEVGPGGRSATA